MFHPSRVGDAGGGLIRNKTGCLQLGLRGIPPIEQKTLDGWGTPMFHPSRVGDAGGGLIRNKTGCLQLGLRGIPPIEQKTLDGWGTCFIHRGSVTPVED